MERGEGIDCSEDREIEPEIWRKVYGLGRRTDKVVYAFAHGRLVLKRSSRNRPSF